MKRWLIGLVCVAMLLCSGCQVFFPSPIPPETEEQTPSPYLQEFRDNWCYQRLSEPLQDCYAAIYDTIMEKRFADCEVTVSDHATDRTLGQNHRKFPGVRINLPHTIENEEDAQALYLAITWDNPQFFFLSNEYYYEGYRNADTDGIVCRSLCLPFTMSAAERRDMDSRLNKAVGQYLSDLPTGDDFAVELALHDRLLQDCEYHTDAGETHNFDRYPNAFTAAGALVDGKAVCEGYSRGMQLLLHRAGIACSLVTGINENGDPHMWNLVTVNGRNYHLDPTWNDVEGRVRHTFFNLTTDSITRTHTIEASVLGVDSCTATEDNYFRRQNHYIDTFERSKIASIIARDMDAGATSIELQFEPPKFINGQLLLGNRQLLMQLIVAQQTAPDARVWEDYEMLVNDTYYIILLYKK